MNGLSFNSKSDSLLLCYLILWGSFLSDEFFTTRLKIFFYRYRWIKHVVAFLTLVFSVMMTEHQQMPLKDILFEGLALYIWFVLSTKLPIYHNLFLICLLLVHFILGRVKDDAIFGVKIEHIQQVIRWLAVGSVIIGIFIYFDEKQLKFGDLFSLWSFMFAGH